MSTDDEFGPRETLAYLLAKDLQEGKNLSEEDWEFLYYYVSKNKPATIEEFKRDFTRRVRAEANEKDSH
jgi:hypothetical protein